MQPHTQPAYPDDEPRLTVRRDADEAIRALIDRLMMDARTPRTVGLRVYVLADMLNNRNRGKDLAKELGITAPRLAQIKKDVRVKLLGMRSYKRRKKPDAIYP